jgi:hypothetical protein
MTGSLSHGAPPLPTSIPIISAHRETALPMLSAPAAHTLTLSRAKTSP